MIRRILLAVDADNESRHAEALGAELAKNLNAEVTVLHVREWLLGPAGPFDDGKRRTADLLRGVADRLQAQGLRVQSETRSTYFAFTARRIAEVAREAGADLIVLGARRRASLIRSLLGADVTSGVLRHATVPVLVATSDGRSSAAGRTGQGGESRGRARAPVPGIRAISSRNVRRGSRETDSAPRAVATG